MKHISVPLWLIKACGHLIKTGLWAYDGQPGVENALREYNFNLSDLYNMAIGQILL